MLSSFFFSKSPMVKLMRYLSNVSVLIYLTTNISCFMTLRSSMYQQVTCLIIVSKKVDFWHRNTFPAPSDIGEQQWVTGFSLCVKCCEMVDSVPRWQLSLSWPIQSDHLLIAYQIIPPLGREH